MLSSWPSAERMGALAKTPALWISRSSTGWAAAISAAMARTATSEDRSATTPSGRGAWAWAPSSSRVAATRAAMHDHAVAVFDEDRGGLFADAVGGAGHEDGA